MNILSIIKLNLFIVISFMLSTNTFGETSALENLTKEADLRNGLTVSESGLDIFYDSTNNQMSITNGGSNTGEDAITLKISSNDAVGFGLTVTATNGVFKIADSTGTDQKFAYQLMCNDVTSSGPSPATISGLDAQELTAGQSTTIYDYAKGDNQGGVFKSPTCDIIVTNADLTKTIAGDYVETFTFELTGDST